jgi:hypothetical protein
MVELASELPACVIDALPTTEARDSRFETRLAILRSRRLEPKCDQGDMAENAEVNVASEVTTPIARVPAGPWRSLGGCFDYSEWKDCERFLELDRALASAQCSEPDEIHSSENVSNWIEGLTPDLTLSESATEVRSA